MPSGSDGVSPGGTSQASLVVARPAMAEENRPRTAGHPLPVSAAHPADSPALPRDNPSAGTAEVFDRDTVLQSRSVPGKDHPERAAAGLSAVGVCHPGRRLLG